MVNLYAIKHTQPGNLLGPNSTVSIIPLGSGANLVWYDNKEQIVRAS